LKHKKRLKANAKDKARAEVFSEGGKGGHLIRKLKGKRPYGKGNELRDWKKGKPGERTYLPDLNDEKRKKEGSPLD